MTNDFQFQNQLKTIKKQRAYFIGKAAVTHENVPEQECRTFACNWTIFFQCIIELKIERDICD